MKDESGGARGPLRRACVLASALAVTALLVAACGGGGGSPPTAAQSKNYQKALAFVQCMRTHGEPTFPDPTSQGIVSDSQASITPQILQAYRLCRTLLPPGDLQLTEAQREQLTTQALKRAQCMRAHGVPNFPDPGPLSAVAKRQLATSLDPSSPVFQAAARVCLGPGFAPIRVRVGTGPSGKAK